MRRLVPTLLLLLLLLMVVGCASIKVTQQRNKRDDFSVYQTFNWLPETGAPTGNPRLDDPIWSAAVISTTNKTLIGKGLQLDLANAPQLWLTYHLTIDRKTRVDDSLLGAKKTESGGGKEYYSGRAMGDQTRRVEEYETGTLIIDVVDAGSMKLIWRGTAEAKLKPSSSMNRKVSRIQSATRKVVNQFPRK